MCQQPGSGLGTPPSDVRGGVLGRSQVRKHGGLPRRRLRAERKKLGVHQREEATFFNNIFHRCCHLSTVRLQNCNCSTSVRTKVGGRAWRKSLGRWVRGSHLSLGLRARSLGRDRAIKGGHVWTRPLLTLDPFKRLCVLLDWLRPKALIVSFLKREAVSGPFLWLLPSRESRRYGVIGYCRGLTFLSLQTLTPHPVMSRLSDSCAGAQELYLVASEQAVWSRGYAAAGESSKQNVFSGIAWWFQNGGRKMVEVLHRPNGLLCVQNELDIFRKLFSTCRLSRDKVVGASEQRLPKDSFCTELFPELRDHRKRRW